MIIQLNIKKNLAHPARFQHSRCPGGLTAAALAKHSCTTLVTECQSLCIGALRVAADLEDKELAFYDVED